MSCATENCRHEPERWRTRCWPCIRARQRYGEWPVRLLNGRIDAAHRHHDTRRWIAADLALLSEATLRELENSAAESGISREALWLEVCKLELNYGERRRPVGGRTAAEVERAARRYLDGMDE